MIIQKFLCHLIQTIHHDTIEVCITNTSLTTPEMGTIVQYILVRGDLLLREGWPVGAVLAQACHAATAAIHLYYRSHFMSLQSSF